MAMVIQLKKQQRKRRHKPSVIFLFNFMPSADCEGLYFMESRCFMSDDLVRDVYERLGAIGEKLDGINHIRDTANRAEDKADEALASTKSAHHRLNKIDKIIWWVSTTIIGAFIVALLALVIKSNGGF